MAKDTGIQLEIVRNSKPAAKDVAEDEVTQSVSFGSQAEEGGSDGNEG